jgi:hypothetical protein
MFFWRRSCNPNQLSGKGSQFFTIWTGQAFSLLGSKLVQFALVWWLTKTTGSEIVLEPAIAIETATLSVKTQD